ncbi:MAG: NAD(+)/NADH kinase [Candidatus Woesearchaeota archaeon]
MKLKNVLLATKQTSLEYYRQNYDKPEEVLSVKELERKKREHKEHYESFNYIKSVLDKHNISYQRVYMPYGAYEEFVDRDLIISIGGDGTVLNTAHYILDKTPILTVKSEGDSVGALCKINAKQFEDTLDKLLNDDFTVESWTRVEGTFNHKKDIALNEIAVGPKYFNGMMRYEVKFKDVSEEQRSSKIMVSTGAGSTGWYNNVEYSQGNFDPQSKELRFVVSEDNKSNHYKLLHGVMKVGDVVEITSLMDIDGAISFDGDNNKRMYDFNIGKKLYVKISDKPLNVIIPK